MFSRQQISATFSRVILGVGFAMAALTLSPAAEAQTTITKANTGTDLGASATWTPATTPSAVDLGLFNSTWTAATTLTFGATLTIGEIKIVNPTNALTIQPGAAQTLNLGNSTFANGGGIDMLSSTVGVTFGTNVGVVLSNSQTWTVGNTTTNHPTLTVSGTINLGANTLSLGGNGTISLGGIISGTGGSITLLSGGANSGNLVVLSGANTYTGGTNLNGGTLAINSATALGTAASRLTINGGTLDNTSGGAIAMTNNNVQTWGGDFTFAGSNALNMGTGAVTMSGSRTLTINASTLTVGGVVSGAGFSLTKNGTGTLVLTGTNTYTGATTINGGTLSVTTFAAGGSNSGIGASSAAAANLSINGGTLQFSGSANQSTDRLFTIGPNGATIDSTPSTATRTLTFTNTGSLAFSSSTDAATLTLTGTGTGVNVFDPVIGDSGTGNNLTSVIKSGANEWVLGGTNTYTGGTTLSAGTLGLAAAAALGGGPLTINGGTLNNTSGGTLTLSNNIDQYWNAGFTFTGTNNLDMGTGKVVLGANIALVDSAGTLTLGGVISDGTSNFNITKSGGGTLVLNGANTFSGNLNISAGTLTLGSVNALQNATLDITAAAATVNLATGTNNIAGLVGVASGNIVIGSNTLAINTLSGVTTTFTGNIITGAGGVTIGGSGTQVMAGTAGNYTGNTTLNSGTLKINAAAAIGTGNLTINGGNLDSSGIAMTTNNALKLNGDFTFIGSGTLNVGTGAVAMNASRTVTVSASTLTVGGIISGAGFGLTKNGTGTMVLTGQSGVSTYNGTTAVNAGTLTLDFTSASSATGIVNSTSALTLNGGTLSLIGKASTSDAQTFSGTTIGAGASTVTLTSGGSGTMNVTLGGITRDAGATVNFVNPTSGCIGINGTIATTNGIYTVGGIAFATLAGTDFATISANHVIAATSTTQNNASSWTTSTTNYAVGAAMTGNIGSNTTINALKISGSAAEAINLQSHALTITTGGIVVSGSTTPTISNGTLKGAPSGELVVVQNSTGTMTISANIVNNTGTTGLTKSGTGNLQLSGANTYNGTTYINSGTLEVASNTALGANGTTVNVANGATLKIDNGIAIGGDNSNAGLGTVSGSLLNLSGTGVGGLGALIAGGATGDWVGNIALTSNATVSSGATASAVLTLGSNSTGSLTSNINLGSNTLTLAGPTSMATDEITSNITGTGNVIVDTAGTAHYLMDGNGYTGNTFVNNGTLILDTTSQGNVSLKTSGNLLAIRGDLTIGDGTGSGNTAIVQFGSGALPDARNLMGSDGNVTIKSDGKLYLNGQTQVIQDLTVNGGYINTANGTNLGLLTINGNTTIQANAATVFFDGNVGLGNSVGGAVNTINVTAGGNATSDLTVNALLNGGGFIKTGNGTMTLSNNGSTFTNSVEVSSGTLVLTVGGNVLGATGNGTTVDAGAQMQLKPSSDITVQPETLTINGNGTANNGALQNIQGNNTWTGTVLTGTNNATINNSGGNTTISGNMGVVSGTPTLTFTGVNTTTLSGNVNGGQNIVINSASTNKVIMSGTLANTYTGTTTVNSGATLELNKTASTAAVSGSTLTVNSGGTLLSDTTEQISAGTAMVLNGGSWTTNGAATASWQENLGTLTLSNNSTINLGSGNNTIAFQSSNATTWTPGSSLYLNNWTGNLSGNGTDQIKFALSTGLSGTSSTGQLGDIIFVNPVVDGSSFSGNYHAIILSTGEVVPFLPAPEPGTVVAGASLAILAGLREWRRRKNRLADSQ